MFRLIENLAEASELSSMGLTPEAISESEKLLEAPKQIVGMNIASGSMTLLTTVEALVTIILY